MNSQKLGNIQDLKEEFKSTFPDLSDEIITACISQHGTDKEMCIQILNNVRQSHMYSGNLSLTQMDKFNSEEITIKEEHYDFKFNNSRNFQDQNTLTKKMNDLVLNNKQENLIPNENLRKIPEFHTFNGNLLTTAKPNTSTSMYEIPTNIYKTSNVEYSDISSNVYVPISTQSIQVVDQDKKQESKQTYTNFNRGFSYPTTNNGNIPYKTQYSQPSNSSGLPPNKLNPENYSVPLFVAVTLSPHYPQANLTNTQTSYLIPLSAAQNFSSPVLPHTTKISPVTFVQTSPSSMSTHYPPFSGPNGNNHPCPTLSISPNIPYSQHAPFYFSQNSHLSIKNWESEMPNLHQKYELSSKSTSGNPFLNISSEMSPSLSNVPCLQPCVVIKTEENAAERAYKKALIEHQKSQYKMLYIEYLKLKQYCYSLRKDVSLKEEDLQRKQRNEFMEEIQKLKDENMKLSVECRFLDLEVDTLKKQLKGQMHLGVVSEGFYKNIFTGPPIPVNSGKGSTSSVSQSNYYQDDDSPTNKWSCSKCTYANHPALEHCEMCDSSRIDA